MEGIMFVSEGENVDHVIGQWQNRDKHYYSNPNNFLPTLGVYIAENGDAKPKGVFKHLQTVVKPKPEINGKIVTMGGYTFPDEYLAWIDLFPVLR